MFNNVYKRCNSNDANAWRDTGSGELHATFFDSRPDGSYALPPMEQTVAQSVAYRRHDMVGTVGAGELPPDGQCPHLAARPPAHRARGGIHAPR